jgi:two-component system sensor histidine kinase CpxA
VVEPPAGAPPILLGPFNWILPFVSVLCCTIGAYVTWRMRRIEAVVNDFGKGELAMRVSSDSGDAIGRLAMAFNRMADRIESLVASHRRLCADMAHELRAPMTRLLLAIPRARAGMPAALDHIEMEADRVNRLLDGLLEVARAEVDPGLLDWAPVDLDSLLTELADECALEASGRGCEIETSGADGAGIVHGDAELLRRAIENIVRNAIQHAPPGTRILLYGGTDADSAIVSVRDRGPGVPDRALSKIFQPFYRVDAADRMSSGAGLGLAIAQRAIALHGGNVRAENCAPGLRVTIRLPREARQLSTSQDA